MRAVIVYESMFGNTHLIAGAIASGLAPGNVITVVPVAEADRALLDGADLVVAGGPTHVHGMSRASTRQAAAEQADKEGSQLSLDHRAPAGGPGLRDWFSSLGQLTASAAAFDTRIDGPAAFTGRASKGIARLLREHGLTLLAPAESFLVTKDNRMRPGEEDRAREWGKSLAAAMAPTGAVRS
jgi:flavodoxin